MREALLKSRCGIPAALLLVLLLSGTVLAWYCFAAISSETKVKEPLSVTETAEFSANMYPGKTNVWTFQIGNAANVTYTIKADLTTFSEPGGVTITSFIVDSGDETGDLKDDGSAEFDISPGTTSCSLTISAARDATPGAVKVELALSRG